MQGGTIRPPLCCLWRLRLLQGAGGLLDGDHRGDDAHGPV